MSKGPDETGRKLELEGLVGELTAQLKSLTSEHAALEEKSEFFRDCLNSANDVLIAYDEKGTIHGINNVGCDVIGYPEEQFKEVNLFEFMGIFWGVDKKDLTGVFEPGYNLDRAFTVKMKDGQADEIYLEIKLRPLSNNPEKAMLCGRDISKRVELEKELQRLATTDELTGLLNWRSFKDEYTAISRGDKGIESFSLLMIDMNNFKEINDYLGHLAGDYAMSYFANVLKDTVRKDDLIIKRNDTLISRYGGDEFVILLKETDENKAAEVAERIIDAMEGNKLYLRDLPSDLDVFERDIEKAIEYGVCNNDGTINLNFAIGVCNSKVGDGNHALAKADTAMQYAKLIGKREGRNAFHVVYH
jgi:diguanylate cyclase (GGDEF)-like protein/PAS domain S-box-containing protein